MLCVDPSLFIHEADEEEAPEKTAQLFLENFEGG
jgi:hypothetical protein